MGPENFLQQFTLPILIQIQKGANVLLGVPCTTNNQESMSIKH